MLDIIPNPAGPDEKIEFYQAHLYKARKKHKISADEYAKWAFIVGYPAAAIQALVAASVFSTFMAPEYPWLRWTAIIVTLISAGLVAVDKALSFEARAKQHRSTERSLKAAFQDLLDERELLKEAVASKDKAKIDEIMARVRILREAWQRSESQAPDFWWGVEDRVDNSFEPVDTPDLIPEKSRGSSEKLTQA